VKLTATHSQETRRATRVTRVTFNCDGLSLEGMLTVPHGLGPFAAVVVCHPHPLYGGNMDNNVVGETCEALDRLSLISLRFNFRGVGRSEGQFSQGVGQQQDIGAAISFASAIEKADSAAVGVVGYSAGAGFAVPVVLADGRARAFAAISPPLSMFDFAALSSCPKPKLFVSGSRDHFTPTTQLLQFCQSLPEPKECVVIQGADHFWWGHEAAAATRVATFLSRALDRMQ
jgi:alpha/beta superfamily hydrolase